MSALRRAALALLALLAGAGSIGCSFYGTASGHELPAEFLALLLGACAILAASAAIHARGGNHG